MLQLTTPLWWDVFYRQDSLMSRQKWVKDNGGRSRIRTCETLRPGRFRGVWIQPLSHPSDLLSTDNNVVRGARLELA